MKKIIALLIAALLLASCAEAPEEVKRENSILDRTEAVSQPDESTAVTMDDTSGSDNGLALCTLDEIRASLDSDIAENNTNVSAKTVRVPESSAMPVFRLQKSFDNYDKIDDIVRDYFGTELSAHRDRLSLLTRFHSVFELTEDLTLTFDTCAGDLIYSDSAAMDRFVMSSQCGDDFCVSNSDPDNLIEPYDGELVEVYDLRHGDSFPDTPHALTDGKELSVALAVDKSQQLMDRYIAELFTDQTRIKVYRAEVYDRGQGYGYTLYAEYADAAGNLFLTNDAVNMDFTEYLKKSSPVMLSPVVMAVFDRTDMPSLLTANKIPAAEEITESGDKLLSYGGALKRMSQRLASASAYEFGCATLEYVITAPYSEEYIRYRTDKDGDVSRTFFKELYTHIPETRYEARPFWVFRDFEKNPENLGESVRGGVYLVDAVTGEVYVA